MKTTKNKSPLMMCIHEWCLQEKEKATKTKSCHDVSAHIIWYLQEKEKAMKDTMPGKSRTMAGTKP